MSSLYSAPKRLKCVDCSVYSIYVSLSKTYNINLCVDCVIERQIKMLGSNKKD